MKNERVMHLMDEMIAATVHSGDLQENANPGGHAVSPPAIDAASLN